MLPSQNKKPLSSPELTGNEDYRFAVFDNFVLCRADQKRYKLKSWGVSVGFLFLIFPLTFRESLFTRRSCTRHAMFVV